MLDRGQRGRATRDRGGVRQEVCESRRARLVKGASWGGARRIVGGAWTGLCRVGVGSEGGGGVVGVAVRCVPRAGPWARARGRGHSL